MILIFLAGREVVVVRLQLKKLLDVLLLRCIQARKQLFFRRKSSTLSCLQPIMTRCKAIVTRRVIHVGSCRLMEEGGHHLHETRTE